MPKHSGRLGNHGLAKASAEGSRVQTIRVLIERHVARHGAEPTDAEIGAILAISPSKVKRYRQRLGR